MFVPVACSQCGKPFQVPEAVVGQLAACPWCQASVLALPVARASAAAPLSLDDNPPQPIVRSQRSRARLVLGLLLVAAVATMLTMGALRRKEGHMVNREWQAFTSPDNSCAIDLTGKPIEDPDAPAANERRYTSEGWYSGTTTWIAWRNLTAAEAQAASTDEAWHDISLMKLFDAERDRVKGQFGGSVAKEGTIQFKDPLIRELRLELPQGKLVERTIVRPTGPRPRVYFLGIAGKRLNPDGDEVKRFFESFRTFD